MYVACIYEEQREIGLVTEISEHEQDVKVAFLYSLGPSRNFGRPRRIDVCWISVGE